MLQTQKPQEKPAVQTNNPPSNNSLRMQAGRPVYAGHYIKMPAHWRRLLALWIDLLIVWLIFGKVLDEIWQKPETISSRWISSWLGTWICFMILHGWPLLKYGQTLGKMFLKLRIVHVDIRPASFSRLLLWRYGIFLLYMVLPGICVAIFLVDALFIFRPSRRSLHDLLAGTAVIQTLEPAQPETPESTLKWP